MKPTVLLVLCFFCVSIHPAWADKPSTCLKQVTPLSTKRDQVAELDGIWGLFQKTTEFRDNSVQGITLDNKINTILFQLEYLCNTIDGIPFDELSDYVSAGLAEKGAEEFKKELIILGKSEGEIDIWFEFSKFAVANRHRALDTQKIFHTIETAQPFIKGYLELAEKINSKERMGSVIQETEDLTNQIETFFKTDPYMSQALYENAQVPYADWDEDVGGS
ncbi:MAG: hypothetical protein HOI59_09010 [Nitrospina sp.]|jgi:hypothetical protein|nr:hypothetical protein [Nitrospina sp.]MBT3415721.1 hypothetical protein [Nitrospina sp.]MBT3856847.1 hypothetical protein [Nitrospina sp.]MBT4104311.1 hypothetical protein [Nitrospina sp.]MBT4390976.1 hypothetical protein [Nitrospina sp.]